MAENPPLTTDDEIPEEEMACYMAFIMDRSGNITFDVDCGTQEQDFFRLVVLVKLLQDSDYLRDRLEELRHLPRMPELLQIIDADAPAMNPLDTVEVVMDKWKKTSLPLWWLIVAFVAGAIVWSRFGYQIKLFIKHITTKWA